MNPVTSLFQKPTVQEIKEATPMRKRVRAKVLEENEVARKLSPYFQKFNVTSAFDKAFTQYSSFLEAELAWWNANIELSPTQVNTREVKFDEQLPFLKNQLDQAIYQLFKDRPSNEIQDFISNYPILTQKPKIRLLLQPLFQQNMTAEQKAQQDLEKRGWWDDVTDAGVSVVSYLSGIVVFLLAVRWGAFAANDTLWQDMSFRTLHFVYTTLLSMIYFPFAFVYQVYKGFNSTPYFASVFPITPMPVETADTGFFGYRLTAAFTNWKSGKLEDFQRELQELLANTSVVLKETKQAKEESMK